MSMNRGNITVVLDTNVWISSRLLRSGLGNSLLFFLNRVGGQLGLPEVVELEMRSRVWDLTMEQIEKARQSLGFVESIIGKSIGVAFPDDEDVQDAISRRMESLKPLLDGIPLTLPQAKGAIVRTIDRVAPCETRKEFRDAAVWEAVIDYASGHGKVLFVTEDSDFCEKRDLKKGLASVLKTEIQDLEVDVKAFFKLGEAVALLAVKTPKVNQQTLIMKLFRALRPDVSKSAQEKGFTLGKEIAYSVDHYPTADPKSLVVSYEIAYALSDISSSGTQARSDASVTVRGECTYTPDSHEIDNIAFDTLAFAWANPDGSRATPRMVYAGAHIRASSSLELGTP